ncbi:MAG: nucleotidyl transferase AbiEii/AbiGii toxin family protein [Acidobacteriota bacterium]
MSPTEDPPLQYVDRLDHGVRSLIAALAQPDWSTDVYLAGSAALALYVGHRPVRHLDLMGYRRLVSAERRDMLQDLLALDAGVRVETARDGYFSLRFGDDGPFGGAGLRFFYYPYPLVGPEEELDGLAVASALDLALMKLGALISRGHRRDFLDLYLLGQLIPLAEQLARSPDKYGHVRDFPLQALKGLSDVEQTRREPMPTLHLEVTWDDVEAWLRGAARELSRSHVGLDLDRDEGR